MSKLVVKTAIQPMESLVISASCDGRHGTNRNPNSATKQINADDDASAILAWLNEVADSRETLRSYRKEAERLLLWSLIMREKPLSSLMREDMNAYHDFLADPQPQDQWCGPRTTRDNPKWRPFKGPLSASSQAQSLSILNALFNFLVETGYLTGNPMGLLRKRKAQQKKLNQPVERFFEQDLWQLIINHIEKLPTHTRTEATYQERIRYLISFFYLLGPRISEIASHDMSSLYHKRGQWWWRVVGKGNKEQSIPVNRPMLNALMRYRRFNGLSDLPSPDDQTPLFMNQAGNRGVTKNRIYRMIKELFENTADAIKQDHPHYAQKLRQASAHWLRHTCITHQTDAGIDMRFIQRNARHSSIETTSRYQHTEEDRWHSSMEAHTLFDSTN